MNRTLSHPCWRNRRTKWLLAGNWLFETKLDGIRAVAIKKFGGTRLYSRRGRDLTDDYQEIAAAFQQIKARQFSMDGEIVALDASGRYSFQLLQNVKRSPSTRGQIHFFAFDLMHLNGSNLMEMPLIVRRHFLQGIVPKGTGQIKLSGSLPGSFQRIWQLVNKLGLEGVMAKRQDSKYEAGMRTGAWVKIKALNQQEFVIGGYTLPEGHREYLGALLVGYYENDHLKYAGKVGTGFDAAALQKLHARFQKIKTQQCPFFNWPKGQGKADQPGTRREVARLNWVKPDIVCEVRFLEWTQEKNLRQPVYLGLRDDKPPTEVTKEE